MKIHFVYIVLCNGIIYGVYALRQMAILKAKSLIKKGLNPQIEVHQISYGMENVPTSEILSKFAGVRRLV